MTRIYDVPMVALVLLRERDYATQRVLLTVTRESVNSTVRDWPACLEVWIAPSGNCRCLLTWWTPRKMYLLQTRRETDPEFAWCPYCLLAAIARLISRGSGRMRRALMQQDRPVSPASIRQKLRESNMKKAILTVLGLSYASLAAASNDNSGALVPHFVSTQNDGIGYVYFQGTRSGTIPACATDNAGPYFRLAFDSNTTGGKSILAILLAAHASGETVWFNGTGDCGLIGSIESLQNVQTGL
jgi:hypothetical protein